MQKEKAVTTALESYWKEHPCVALAFSGGCDSAYLLYSAVACGVRVDAYYVKTCFQPEFELRDAKRLAAELGVNLKVIEMDVLSDPLVKKNDAQRCYYCKRRIFEAILLCAEQDGYDLVADGTNASDDAADRPGMRAIGELKVVSPLRHAGIGKSELRELSRRAGLFTWDKPAYACLATRIPCGTEITREMLEKAERAEERMMQLGFSDLRVRISGDDARLELRSEQFLKLVEKREAVLDALGADFRSVLLDLKPRKGF